MSAPLPPQDNQPQPLQVTPVMLGDFWNNQAVYMVYVANLSDQATKNGWNVNLIARPGVSFSNLWNAQLVSADGMLMKLKQPAWNQSIPPHSSVSFGGILKFDAGTPPPYLFSATGYANPELAPPQPTPPPVAPGLSAPKLNEVKNDGKEAFSVDWVGSSLQGGLTGVPAYQLQQATDPMFNNGLHTYPPTTSLSQQVAVNKQAQAVTYYFRVMANLGNYSSEASNTVSATVSAQEPPTPQPPAPEPQPPAPAPGPEPQPTPQPPAPAPQPPAPAPQPQPEPQPPAPAPQPQPPAPAPGPEPQPTPAPAPAPPAPAPQPAPAPPAPQPSPFPPIPALGSFRRH